jgi:hypothetical protein
MKSFRYFRSNQWLKGNTHIHSTASDGGLEFKELADIYHPAGYDFLFRTDHWVTSDIQRETGEYPLLWIDGVELDGHDNTGSYLHVVCLGRLTGINQEQGIDAALVSAREQGAIRILAHPHWCGNRLEDAVRWQLEGVELYNHVCHWLNGKSNGLVHWDAALKHNPNTLAFAVDDSHLLPEHPGWNGGWIMVNASECAPSAILNAIRLGKFYSSCGPEFRTISLDGNEVHLEMSPVRFVRLVGPDWKGYRVGSFDGPLITQTNFPIPDDWGYVYVEIEDQQGRRAWTNNLFIDTSD